MSTMEITHAEMDNAGNNCLPVITIHHLALQTIRNRIDGTTAGTYKGCDFNSLLMSCRNRLTIHSSHHISSCK